MEEENREHDSNHDVDISNEHHHHHHHKSSKTLMQVTICVLALVIIGLIGYIIIDKSIWSQPSTQSPNNQPQNQTATSDDATTEITDAAIISDLNKKTAILLSAPFDGYDWTSTVTNNSFNYLDSLMKNGGFAAQEKVYNILYSLYFNDAFSKITTSDYSRAEASEAIKDTAIEGYPDEFYNHVTKIDADTIAKIYKDLYGEDIKHQSAKELCGGFFYDSKKGLYLKGLYDACGGASPISYNLYREKYEAAGDKAYAHIRIGTVRCEHDEVNCTFYSGYHSYDDTQKMQPLGTVNSSKYFANQGEAASVITADNFEDFAPYRLVFTKASDGNYVFDGLEKL